MGTSAVSEPLNFFIIVIYDLWPTYSFLFAPLKMVALTTSQIYLNIYLIDILHILTQYLCKLIGCEAQEGVE